MKKFLKKMFLYVGITSILIGGWALCILICEIYAYQKQIKLPETAEYVLVGDSQTAYGINPEFWPGLFNFSKEATSLDQCYMKVLDLCSANPGRIKRLILDVSLLKYTAGEGGYHEMMHFDKPHPQFFINLLHWRENTRSLDGVCMMFRDVLMCGRSKFFWRVLRGKKAWSSLFGGGYLVIEGIRYPDDVKQAKWLSLADNVSNTINNGKWGRESLSWVGKILEFAQAKGMEAILISTPMHKDLLERVDGNVLSEFRKNMSDVALKYNVRYCDFTDMHVPDAGWYDVHHLNSVGAAFFTPYVSKSVQDPKGAVK